MSHVSAMPSPLANPQVPFFVFQEDDNCFSYIAKLYMLLFQWLRSPSTIDEHFSQLSKQNIRWLTKEQIAGVDPAKIQLLTQEQLEGFTPQVVFNFFSLEQAKAYSRVFRKPQDLLWHIHRAPSTADVFRCLNQLDLDAVQRLLPSYTNIFSYLREDRIQEFDLEQIQQLLPYINSSAFGHLSTVQRQSLRTAEMTSQQVRDIFSCSPSLIHEFTPEQIRGLQSHLTLSAFAKLSGVQLQSLQTVAMPPAQVRDIFLFCHSSLIHHFTTQQIRGLQSRLSWTNFTHLSRVQLQAIQIEHLSYEQTYHFMFFMADFNDLTSDQLRQLKIQTTSELHMLQKLLPRFNELSSTQRQYLQRFFTISLSEEDKSAERTRLYGFDILTHPSFDLNQRQYLLNLITSPVTINRLLLFVLPEDSTQDIKTAYKKLSLIIHPDKWPENQAQATAAFQKIKAAYEALVPQ